jgi:hypothetical protein
VEAVGNQCQSKCVYFFHDWRRNGVHTEW